MFTVSVRIYVTLPPSCCISDEYRNESSFKCFKLLAKLSNPVMLQACFVFELF